MTLVEKRDRVLDFVDHEIVDELIHQMRKRNVICRFGEAVERLDVEEGPPRRAVLSLESGKRIVSDLVLLSAGPARGDRVAEPRRWPGSPRTTGVGLAVDVTSGPRSARLRRRRRHRLPRAWPRPPASRGGWPPATPSASPAGPMAAHFPVGIYAIPEISMVGGHRAGADRGQRAVRDRESPATARSPRGQILGDDSGLLKMLFHREDRRLLGAHAIGTGATELIHIGQAVLGLGGGLDYFMRTVFNYPTLAECYKVAALDAANKLAI